MTNKKLTENDSFGEKNYPNKELFDKIVSKTKEIAGENGVNYHIGKNFSVDTIIAQFAHLDEIIDMGCNCIEMETSVLFKRRKYVKLTSARYLAFRIIRF